MNILSFDLEEWYLGRNTKLPAISKWYKWDQRAEIGTDRFLSLLDKYGLKATFFVMGWLAEQRPDLIVKIAEKGHEIGFHSYLHQKPADLTRQQFEYDLKKGLNLLKNITGKKPVMYRAPMFSLSEKTLWAIPILLQNGIRISSSFKAHSNILGISVDNTPFYFSHSNGMLLELPLTRALLFGMKLVYTGSGFMRILPASVLNNLFSNSEYNMLYFHPRDFDTEMPYSNNVSLYRNMINKLGTGTSNGKMESLIRNFDFTSVLEASLKISAFELPILDLSNKNSFVFRDQASGL